MSTNRKRFWVDARFLIGLALVAASVAGVWAVIAVTRQSTPVATAAHTIVAGQPVTAADITTVDVALGATADTYLADLTDGVVAARTIHAGELIPATAVIPAERSAMTTVVIHSSVEVPSTVVQGAKVEVWVAPMKDRTTFDAPRILIPDATVVAVTRDGSMMGGNRATLELVIPRSDVAAALQAMSSGGALSVVPTSGGVS